MTDPTNPDFDRLAQLRPQDFDDYLGQEFLCDLVTESFVLQRVANLKRSDGVQRERPPFILHFWNREHLPQRVYPLHHEYLGLLPMFLVPIGRADDGYAYEAVFH